MTPRSTSKYCPECARPLDFNNNRIGTDVHGRMVIQCCCGWAGSAVGIRWPERYHGTYMVPSASDEDFERSGFQVVYWP